MMAIVCAVTQTDQADPRLTRVLGIDLAAGPANTAACVVEWSAGRPRLDLLHAGDVSDDLIAELHLTVDATGIDAPFGWPRAFAQTVGAYAAGEPWPRVMPRDLWFRRTDDAALRAAGGRPPLSVSSDRIARPAERAARLLSILGPEDRPLRRDGSDYVIEVYPAGALRMWGIPAKGYKRPEGATVREAIVSSVVTATGLAITSEHRGQLVAADHPIDALISALVASAFLSGQVLQPTTEEQAIGLIEGWLYLPNEPLAQLSAPVAPTPAARCRKR